MMQLDPENHPPITVALVVFGPSRRTNSPLRSTTSCAVRRWSAMSLLRFAGRTIVSRSTFSGSAPAIRKASHSIPMWRARWRRLAQADRGRGQTGAPSAGDTSRDNKLTVFARDGDLFVYDNSTAASARSPKPARPKPIPIPARRQTNRLHPRGNLYVLSLDDGFSNK